MIISVNHLSQLTPVALTVNLVIPKSIGVMSFNQHVKCDSPETNCSHENKRKTFFTKSTNVTSNLIKHLINTLNNININHVFSKTNQHAKYKCCVIGHSQDIERKTYFYKIDACDLDL